MTREQMIRRIRSLHRNTLENVILGAIDAIWLEGNEYDASDDREWDSIAIASTIADDLDRAGQSSHCEGVSDHHSSGETLMKPGDVLLSRQSDDSWIVMLVDEHVREDFGEGDIVEFDKGRPIGTLSADTPEAVIRMIAASRSLAHACLMAVGYCVDFRERHPNDWKEFLDVGRLFSIVSPALAKADGSDPSTVPPTGDAEVTLRMVVAAPKMLSALQAISDIEHATNCAAVMHRAACDCHKAVAEAAIDEATNAAR